MTINTDDPPMFGTDLNTEYAIAARLLDLDEHGSADLALAAVGASFAARSPGATADRDQRLRAATAPELPTAGPASVADADGGPPDPERLGSGLQGAC